MTAVGVAAPHIPVLLDEVMAALAIVPGEVHVDGTFGAGGYTRAMLAAGAKVHAIDQDPDALAMGAELVASSQGALTLHQGNFADMEALLAATGVDAVDGIVLDIGVSSMQLDQAERGFAFMQDGPLDMRMAQSGDSAADLVNNLDEAALADIIYRYGEEHRSRRIARAIVAARPITRTGELASVVRRAVGHHPGMPKDPATRTFQALRIEVNHELDVLEAALVAAERLLRPGGRLVVVTFHSLEDRIVKQFLRDRSASQAAGSRHMPQVAQILEPSFAKPERAVKAGEAELRRNPRARSATLRAARRTVAPARSLANMKSKNLGQGHKVAADFNAGRRLGK